jgi:hypothetical protein
MKGLFLKLKSKPAENPIKIRPIINTSNEPIHLLRTIKIEPITAGILFSNNPVFLRKQKPQEFVCFSFHIPTKSIA